MAEGLLGGVLGEEDEKSQAEATEALAGALAKLGHFKQALDKYDEALKYAPNWAALKQAREAAAHKSG